MCDMDARKVVVLGAGVAGMCSAVCIKEACPDVEVELIADKFSPHTTSDGSAGFWTPYILGDTSVPLIRDVSKATHDYLLGLAFSSSAVESGVQQLSGYTLLDHDAKNNAIFHDQVDGYRILQPSEIKKFPSAKSGYFYTSVQVDVPTFLPWMMRKFQAMGGKVRCARVQSLKEFSGQCDLLVNCCGLGSKQLLDDQQMLPVRGQVLRVVAPWIKHFYTLKTEDGTFMAYIFPGTKDVVVGGTNQRGDWNTDPQHADTTQIWKTATDFLPMLKEAKVVSAWAGLRPGRSSLRLEKEELQIDGQTLKVIHNYGHGGSGVTMCWGCAQHVTEMALDFLGRHTTSPNRVVKAKL